MESRTVLSSVSSTMGRIEIMEKRAIKRQSTTPDVYEVKRVVRVIRIARVEPKGRDNTKDRMSVKQRS